MVPAPYYTSGGRRKEPGTVSTVYAYQCIIAVLATNYVVAKGHVQKCHIMDKWVLAMCCYLELPVRAILSPSTVQGYHRQLLGMIQ